MNLPIVDMMKEPRTFLFQLRLSEEEHKALRDLAKSKKRSMHGMAVHSFMENARHCGLLNPQNAAGEKEGEK